MTKSVDLFVIGGGINGAAVARDAVGRGLTVQLAEMGDYASATSSASSKLIHGGLRYLESYEFGLVRSSLKEREVMMRIAPHLVYPDALSAADEPQPAALPDPGEPRPVALRHPVRTQAPGALRIPFAAREGRAAPPASGRGAGPSCIIRTAGRTMRGSRSRRCSTPVTGAPTSPTTAK